MSFLPHSSHTSGLCVCVWCVCACNFLFVCVPCRGEYLPFLLHPLLHTLVACAQCACVYGVCVRAQVDVPDGKDKKEKKCIMRWSAGIRGNIQSVCIKKVCTRTQCVHVQSVCAYNVCTRTMCVHVQSVRNWIHGIPMNIRTCVIRGVYKCTSMCEHVHTHTHIFAHTQCSIHTQTRMQTHTRVHIRTCT